MSWRGSGNFRGSGGSDWRGTGGKGNGGSDGSPPLTVLIGVVLGIGVIVVIAIVFFSTMTAAPVAVTTPSPIPTAAAEATALPAPVAAATSAPVAAATSAPVAAATSAPVAAATSAPTVAAATSAPTAAASTTAAAATKVPAGIPTEPLGPAVTTGTGTKLEIGSKGEELFFDKSTLEATAGETYTLTFTNNSTAVQHNWVLVEGGADVVTAVEKAAATAQTKARNVLAAVPPEGTPGMLVAMPIVNPGESGSVTFTAPTKPGTYTFICTFPGHYVAGMTGTLVVK